MNEDILSLMRDKLIEARTKEEQRLELFAKSISSINIKEVFGDTYVPPIISLKALCPEAYKDFPNPDIYEKEFNEMCSILSEMNKKIIEYNSEAMELLQQFKMLD